jgi:hypothetical protein
MTALLLLIFTRCGNLTQMAGAGVETTNGCVIGSLVGENGLPDSNALVRLFPADYDPLTNDNAFPLAATNRTGSFNFNGIDTGTYTVVAAHAGLGTKAAAYNIKVAGDTVRLAMATMRMPGSVLIRIPEQYDTVDGYFYIPGTGLTVTLKNASGGSVVIDSVPAGEIPGIMYAVKSADVAPQVFVRSVIVPSAGTITLVFTQWSFYHRITLNTTSSGAGISSTIVNFPVLVRIDRSNFNFNEASADGNDLRFAKSDGSSLPYEIERWDPVAKLAEVWVRVDTIHGNDGTQSMTMYWGNTAAAPQSNPNAVFDTAAGFAGVWHLGQSAGATIADATANGNNGTATATATVGGAVGMAQSFDGTSSFIRTSGPNMANLNFPDTGRYSVSAWVRTEVLDSVFHGVVYKSNEQYGLQMRPKNEWEFYTYIDRSRWEMSRSPASDNSWHTLTGVRNGSKQYLYVDGMCFDSSIVTRSTNLARVTDQPLEIGHCPDGGNDPDRFFNGAIDEVRVEKNDRNADWIKLCYMNQKAQDALVKW